jgi:hypothetical protein
LTHTYLRGTEVEFDVKEFSKDPLYETGNRIEHAERNTSASYGWWKIMNILWIEWPGKKQGAQQKETKILSSA